MKTEFTQRQQEIYDSLSSYQQTQFREVEACVTRWESVTEITRVLKDCQRLSDGI